MAPTIPPPHLVLYPQPLTQAAFASFGTLISSPLEPSRNTPPYPPPQTSEIANQGTALKFASISPITSNYRLSPSGAPAEPRNTLFACFPHQLRPADDSTSSGILDVRLLERHPYTSQTFLPLAFHIAQGQRKSSYLVIVAPTLPSPEPGVGLTPYFPQLSSMAGGPPDLKNLKAFVAEEGMGVNYGVGVWHAPMVVIGEGRVDFVVTQWMSGKAEEDCQEVDLGARFGEGIEIMVPKLRGPEKAKL